MVLPSKGIRYGNVEVKTARLTAYMKDTFANQLVQSLQQWRDSGIQAVFFRITLEVAPFAFALRNVFHREEDCFLAPILAIHGFKYHEVKPEQLTMTRWLPNSPSGLETHACNWQAVSAIVVDRNGRILLVEEDRRKQDGWTLPGGHVLACESIFESAKRKVNDETGIRAEALEARAIIALTHKVATRNSNVGTNFYYCLMCVDDENGGEQAELPQAPEGFSTRWFTRDELKDARHNIRDQRLHIYSHHHKVLMEYDRWLISDRAAEEMFFFDSIHD
ncbi:hypothetical protein Aduo_009757 [Ancylostoma duodenale]